MSAFIDAVAARAKVEPDTVAAVFADRGVREWLPGPPPARLRSVTFALGSVQAVGS